MGGTDTDLRHGYTHGDKNKPLDQVDIPDRVGREPGHPQSVDDMGITPPTDAASMTTAEVPVAWWTENRRMGVITGIMMIPPPIPKSPDTMPKTSPHGMYCHRFSEIPCTDTGVVPTSIVTAKNKDNDPGKRGKEVSGGVRRHD